ncbi:MAG: energy-coupling factor transporter transmembrane protein EcfT [Oscillospiraceae bacterium]|nr:energy-coupling factor transporter transmembrane protein EcfT [Oscillospiraceae bacterium]
MLKDITLGQYFPTGSLLHRLDARLKIVLVFALIFVTFITKGALAFAMLFAFIIIIALLSKVPLSLYIKSLRPMVFLIVLTGVLNLFVTPGEVVWSLWFLSVTREGLILAGYMFCRIVLLIVTSSILTYTTSPIQLTTAIEHLLRPLRIFRFPCHEVALMMTIALRFIPTLLEETEKIMKAQQARGADFSSGNLIRRARAMIPILVPLFIGSFRRADELAIAMEARCYCGGEGRTSLNILKFGRQDLVAAVICVGVIGLIVGIKA